MIFVFYFFAAGSVFLGYKSLRGGINYLAFFKKELAKPKSNYTPFCSIIVPCRGLDEGLRENLFALFRQDFPSYEILFVVDDKRDKAVKIIEEVSRQDAKAQRKINRNGQNLQVRKSEKNFAPLRLGGSNSVSTKLVIAGMAKDEGQKVHNLRQAVLEVSGKSEVFVLVDSDVRPNKNWLGNLIAPLQDENVGAATGYRWFISKKGGFSTELRSVWNASIASALGAKTNNNFCWGGSTAIRRDVFEKLDMRERLKGTLSDDFAVTRALKEARLPIYFVPQCLTASIEDCTFGELLEFTTRQMKITCVYAPNLWKASFIGSFFFTAIFWTDFILLFLLAGWHFWLTLAFLSAIFALGVGKARLRLTAVKLVLKNYESQLNKSLLPHLTLWTITPVIYFYNCLCAFFSNQICWRGITYKLKSPNETVILQSNTRKK
ncbi:MAG: glycosyltransferase family 2 protein [Acidobacteria bacterium]|nr:glycosyltransferase family 2 protein [Acidobacteriota bacterium]